MKKYKSKDGLMSSDDPKAVENWDRFGQELARREAVWSAKLIEMGVKMAHPDDGWVRDRGTKTERLSPSYPDFNLDPQVGDLIALGRPPAGSYFVYNNFEERTSARYGYRICKVTAVENHKGVLGGRYAKYFLTDTGQRVPEEAPRPSKKKSLRRLLKRKKK